MTEDFRKQSDGSWIVLGSAGVDDLYERLGLPEDEDIDSNTVNGLVQEKTCRLPKVGDRFTLGSYDGVVTRTAKRRVTEVRLTPAENTDRLLHKTCGSRFFRYDPSRENAFGALRGAHLKSSNLPIKNPPGEQRRGDFFRIYLGWRPI